MTEDYLPIEHHGIIGDMHTAALVGLDGTIDWWCYPHFDSPSVFGAILDARRGGVFRLAPVPDQVRHKQLYMPDTNVLITRFLTPGGVGELTDFMPVGAPADGHGHHQLIRRVASVRGVMLFRLECRPAFDYGRARHTVELRPDGAVFRSPACTLGFSVPALVHLQSDGVGVTADFTLEEGQTLTLTLGSLEAGARSPFEQSEGDLARLLDGTVDYWHRWIGRCTYRGRWREMVNRSALVLKLLTYDPTGAIVAAATTGLPEEIGGVRNWDYRYTWIRDASFTLYAFMRIGLIDEARHFMEWLRGRVQEPHYDGSLQIVYGIDGRHDLHEEALDHLDGYRGSRPVRIGNAAHKQLQLDIYGELMDAVYLFNKHGTPIDYGLWTHLRRLLNWLADHWTDPDEGIWEMRGARQHFVYSKLMCWVAFDRGLRLADKRSFPADRARWLQIRDTIYEEIMTRGWNRELAAFVQAYESETLDASTLVMPLVFFLSPTDPRMLSTLDAIQRELVRDSLVYRYRAADGLVGGEGTFSLCTFWLVEAMTRAGRVAEARLIFEKMLSYANHLGLFAEEVGATGEALGNFPQAFTHLALISAAYNLDRTLGKHD